MWMWCGAQTHRPGGCVQHVLPSRPRSRLLLSSFALRCCWISRFCKFLFYLGSHCQLQYPQFTASLVGYSLWTFNGVFEVLEFEISQVKGKQHLTQLVGRSTYRLPLTTELALLLCFYLWCWAGTKVDIGIKYKYCKRWNKFNTLSLLKKIKNINKTFWLQHCDLVLCVRESEDVVEGKMRCHPACVCVCVFHDVIILYNIILLP